MSVRSAVTTVARPLIGVVQTTSNTARSKRRAERPPFDLVSLESGLLGKYKGLDNLSLNQISQTWSFLQDLDIIQLRVSSPNSKQLTPLFLISVFCRMSGRRLIASVETDPKAFHSSIGRWLFRKIILMSDEVIVQSDHQGRSVGFSKSKLTVVPIFDSATVADEIASSKIVPNILAVGSRNNGSSIVTVLRAYDLVKQKYPRAEITVLGNNSAIEDSQRISEKLRCHGVMSLDWLNEDKIDLADYDLVINMSDTDYLEPVVLQAGAIGIPLFSTISESAKELLYSPDINFMFGQTDQLKLANMIFELIEEPGKAARMFKAFKRHLNPAVSISV